MSVLSEAKLHELERQTSPEVAAVISAALDAVARGSTVVHSFDIAADPSGVNTALVAGVNTGIVIPAGSMVLPYGLTVSIRAAWDGSTPGLGLGVSLADLVAGTNTFQQDLTSSDGLYGLGPTAIDPGGVAISPSGTSVYFPDQTELWVALYDENVGYGNDPGSTTGTAKLLVAYTPPAA